MVSFRLFAAKALVSLSQLWTTGRLPVVQNKPIHKAQAFYCQRARHTSDDVVVLNMPNSIKRALASLLLSFCESLTRSSNPTSLRCVSQSVSQSVSRLRLLRTASSTAGGCESISVLARFVRRTVGDFFVRGLRVIFLGSEMRMFCCARSAEGGLTTTESSTMSMGAEFSGWASSVVSSRGDGFLFCFLVLL